MDESEIGSARKELRGLCEELAGKSHVFTEFYETIGRVASRKEWQRNCLKACMICSEAAGIEAIRSNPLLDVEQPKRPPLSDAEFASAYEKGFHITARFLQSIGANPDTAQEVAQAAWARGWQCREQLHNPDSVGAWINSIARNIHRNKVLLEQRFDELEEFSVPCTLLRTLEAGSMMSVCSELEVRMLQMFYIEGYTALEIAEREHMCATTVRVRLMRIRRSLRERLERVEEAPAAAA